MIARRSAVPSWAALLALVVVAACRRQADAPLSGAQLFPDAQVAGPQGVESAKGSVTRAEPVTEAEPNDDAQRAQPVPAVALIAGQLGLAGVAGLAGPAGPAGPVEAGAAADAPQPDTKIGKGSKGSKDKGPAPLLDQDWYRLPAVPMGHIVQIELRDSPTCAELELFDDTGKTLLRRAQRGKAVRPVLPSLGPGARASLVRVVCKGKQGGPYTLGVFTRPVQPGEEVEPNDTVTPELVTQLQALSPNVPLQGTLAPDKDIDHLRLELPLNAADLQTLSVTGIPDVEYSLQLLDPMGKTPLLTRAPGKGQGVLVPNLSPAKLPAGTILQIKALSGQAPDTSYAVALQTFLPAGCARQADCPNQLPTELEPNDTADRAQEVILQATAGNALQIAGLLDGPGDVDWYAVVPPPGLVGATPVVSLKLEAPPTLPVQLRLPERMLLATADRPALLVGTVMPNGRLLVAVAADKAGQAARNEAYRLTIEAVDGTDWEQEAGDEARGPALWTANAALRPVAVGNAPFEHGGWQRRGVIAPLLDVDTFGVDLRNQPGPTGLELVCEGDGQPGLTCAVQDFAGRELSRISPAPTGESRVPLALAPGAYRVAVAGQAGRPSLRPYRAALRIAPEHAGLPVAATGTTGP